MLSLPKPEVIFTHESDLDGLVSGLWLVRLAEHAFGEKPKLEAFHHHAWRQRSFPEKSAWVADLTFEARIDRPNWVVIDHHTTDAVPRKTSLIHDVTKSASLLCYELCQQHGLASATLDRLVHLSNVADLFLEEDPHFVTASDYASMVKIYQFWNIYELIGGRLEDLLDHPLLEVMAVKRRVENPLGFSWSKSNITALSPTVGFVDTVVGNINIIVHQLLEEQDVPFPVLLTLLRKGNGTIIASVRSRNGEAIKVAEQLHGGGHANAAGATLPKFVQQIPEAIVYLKQVLSPAPKPAEPIGSLESAFDALERSANKG
jgi:hypothetical protein